MNELVREIEKSYTRSGEHNVTTQYKAAFYDLAEKFDLLLKERNTLSEWNQCTMNAGGDLVQQIAQLTKERDELKAEVLGFQVREIGIKGLTACAEKERDQLAAKCAAKDHALKLVTICPTCEGSKVFAPECPACLGGAPGRCTCAEQEAEPCPECEGSGRLFSGVVEEALSDQCGVGWLSPEKKKMLVEALEHARRSLGATCDDELWRIADRAVKQALEAVR